jgi:hypothetical protein
MQTMLNSRELNVSNLTSGVYIIKINEKTLQLLENNYQIIPSFKQSSILWGFTILMDFKKTHYCCFANGFPLKNLITFAKKILITSSDIFAISVKTV